jgi:hypothetical protein
MGISGRIARTFLTSQLTPLIALMAALMGLFAILVTPREEEPQINVTMANVFIPFPGASAKDVESLVATPAEQVLSQISGIEHVYSVSRPGMAILTVQYKVGEDRIAALVRLYDTTRQTVTGFPPIWGWGNPSSNRWASTMCPSSVSPCGPMIPSGLLSTWPRWPTPPKSNSNASRARGR